MAQPLFNSINAQQNDALGGFLGGMSDSFSLANADRDLVDRDRTSRAKQMEMDEFEMNTPARAAKRAEEIAKSEYSTEEITSGRKRDASQAEMEIKLQQAIGLKTSNEKAQMEKEALGMMKATARMEGVDESNPLLAQAQWDGAREEAEKHGVKGMPATYSAANLERLRQGGKAAMTTIPFLQEKEKTSAANKFTSGENELTRQNQRDIATGHDAASIEGARLRGVAAQSPEDRMGLKPMLQQLETKLLAAKSRGEPIDADELQTYLGLSLDKDDKITKATAAAKQGILQDLMLRPAERKKIAQQLGTPDATPDELATALARRQATGAAIQDELRKFEGAVITKGGKPVIQIQGGKEVPIEGPTSGASPNALPSSPMGAPAPPMGPASAMPPIGMSESGGMPMGGGEQLPPGTMAPRPASLAPVLAPTAGSKDDALAAKIATSTGKTVLVKDGVYMSKGDGDITKEIYDALPSGAKYKSKGKTWIKE